MIFVAMGERAGIMHIRKSSIFHSKATYLTIAASLHGLS